MAINSFKIIALKAVRPRLDEFPENNARHYEKVEAIQKVLYDTDKWFYFYKGITISEDNSQVEMTSEAKKDFSLYDTDELKISLCAVVGRNGAGKSSIVELLVRTINNLAAVMLGEGYNFSAAEHLHFIDYVFADLCFQIGNVVYILEAHGRHVTLKYYKASIKHYFIYKPYRHYYLLDQNSIEKLSIPLKKHREGRRILKTLFYTMVCNYSLYGFNYRDFFSEATPAARLQALHIKASDENPTEDSLWLKGIFHKNDGYQTPIVLHPMRDDGKLNVANENALAKERLTALLFFKDKSGNYPLRVINGDLHVTALHIRPTKNRKFAEGNMINVLGINTKQNISKNYDRVRNCILSFWDEKYGIFEKGNMKEFHKDACDYIVYKTLKIVKSYRKYKPVFNYLSKSVFFYEELIKKLEPLAHDFSHITKKLLQTINYLTTDMYTVGDNNYNLEFLEQEMEEKGMRMRFKGYNQLIKQNLLPPPIFDLDLILTKDKQGNGTIPFSSISSGERQIAYTISNLMYHMVNVDSEWNDYYRKDRDHLEVIKYHYMNVIFDEVELYFHPEMQRQYTSIMLKTLRSVQFSNIRGINIMMVTHSPFVLSDIPDSNVLCLGEGNNIVTRTLGGNIMEMLSGSFFMKNSIGDVIKEEIASIVDMYNKAVRESKNVKKDYINKRVRFRYVCKHVGDDFLKCMLTKMVDDISKAVKQI